MEPWNKGDLVVSEAREWGEEKNSGVLRFVQLPCPDRIYSIRSISQTESGLSIGLNEIVNPFFEFSDGMLEPEFSLAAFRHLPNDEVTDLIKNLFYQNHDDEKAV